MPALDADREKFAALDAQVLDISTDSTFSHLAWQKNEIGIMHIPMCADFYPHGAVAQAFGVFREGPPIPGICERSAFIVDKSGKVRFAKLYALDRTPDNNELLRVLEGMQEE